MQLFIKNYCKILLFKQIHRESTIERQYEHFFIGKPNFIELFTVVDEQMI